MPATAANLEKFVDLCRSQPPEIDAVAWRVKVNLHVRVEKVMVEYEQEKQEQEKQEQEKQEQEKQEQNKD